MAWGRDCADMVEQRQTQISTGALGLVKEDSPSGLWRTLGKRVGLKPSGVRIPHPPRRIMSRDILDTVSQKRKDFGRTKIPEV